MKNTSFFQSPPVYLEISEDMLKAVRENTGVEIALERSPDGRLTGPGREKLTAALKKFLAAKNWQLRSAAWCAINARGVSLRRLALPPGTQEEFNQRLLLQIEAEFPLSPDELAWGCQPINVMAAKSELLVAAVRKTALAEYHDILSACGLEPVFTLAAMARLELAGQALDACAWLEIGNTRSELTVFEKGVIVSSRLVSGGSENGAGLTEGLTGGWLRGIGTGAGVKKLFLSGNKVSDDFIARLTRSLGSNWQCERPESEAGEGRSAAISGLKKMAEQNREPALLIRLGKTTGRSLGLAGLDLKKWAVRAGALVAAVLLLPYVEALVMKPHLLNRVAAFKLESERLAVIDHELDFLRGLKQSQPPYLDLLSVFSKSVPPGTHFDALSLNSHGDVSLHCAFQDGQQVADFRTKLIVSGFFTNVTVEEQVPTPDHQRVNVRIDAQEKSMAQVQALAISMAAGDAARAAKDSAATNPPLASAVASSVRKEGQ